MSQQNAEIVRASWDAWTRGDMDAIFEFYDPEIEWDMSHSYVPDMGVFHGRGGIREFFRERRAHSSACVACLIAITLSLLATPAVAAPRLDARFGDGGVARARFSLLQRQELFGALRPVRQANGKVLVAAHPFADRTLSNQVLLARFGRGGALDPTFGRRGRLRITFPWQFEPRTVFAQRDGRIVLVGAVGGYAYFSYRPSQLGILRLLPDGSRDVSFGTNGFVAWNPPWRVANEFMDVLPVLAWPQAAGRLLVAATVDERAREPNPATSWQRVVLVRFQPDGSPDQSFGQGGFAGQDWDSGYFRGWARLADGSLASVVSRNEGPGMPTLESAAWWLHSFTADGSPAELRSTGSVRLGLNVVDELDELVPTGDGALLMIGDVDIDHARGPAIAVRRILPDGSLDATFGRECAQPPLRAGSRGGAATADGGVLVTASRLLVRARPRRFDSLAIPYDATGCIAATPLRLRGLIAGPPLLQRGRSPLVGATFQDREGLGGLALIKIRR
jgi:uncharacterized delta-60 repeat protein